MYKKYLNFNKHLVLVVAIVLAVTAVSPVWAVTPVRDRVHILLNVKRGLTDAADFAKDAITAGENLLQTVLAQTAEYHRLRNLARFNPRALAKLALPEDISDLALFVAELRKLYGNIDDAETLFDDRMRLYAASNLAWEAWVAREKQLAKEEKGDARLAFEKEIQALQRIQKQRTLIQKMQSQIDMPEGAQQSLQTMNQHLNMIAEQNTYLVEMLATKAMTESRDKVVKAAERDRLSQIIEREKKAQKISNESIDRLFSE